MAVLDSCPESIDCIFFEFEYNEFVLGKAMMLLTRAELKEESDSVRK